MAIAVVGGGCANLPERVTDAAADSIRQPGVWMPLAGAAVLQFDDWDHRTSAWARARTPLFGSQASADQWSDRLRAFPAVVEVVSVLATPGGDDFGEWVTQKVELGAVDIAAVGSSMLVARGLKTQTARLRPNRADRESFPSGHAVSAAANARVAALNLENAPWSPGATRALDWALDVTVFGTGWARVESGWHYPSDSLVGIAAGNFFAAVVHRSLLRSEALRDVSVVPERGGAQLRMSWAF